MVKPTLIPGAKIFLVGEAPGEHEERQGLCFVGPSGRELTSMLDEADISRGQVSLSNVFLERPPANDLNAWAESRRTAPTRVNHELPWSVIPCTKGILPPERVQPALSRLHAEIERINPNVIVTLGNTALAALCGVSGITKLRGSLHFFRGREGRNIKVIPTYHPAGVLRQYEWRPAVVADFLKAKEESRRPDALLRNRRLYLAPTLDDLSLIRDRLGSATHLSIDIETKAKQITCVGFAPSAEEVYVIPFWSGGSGNYWERPEDEAEAYKLVRDLCQGPATKIFQNGLYDVQYLQRYGIVVSNFTEDTMILHHSLYPAMPKALGFLGSLYCNERAWKQWRVRGGETHELKREE